MHKKIKGFTLVEVMIVVAILALLASLIVPNALRARIDANDAAAQAALKTVSTALESYANVNNIYPSATTSLTAATPAYISVDYFTGTHNGFAFTSTLTNQTYSVTADPKSANYGSRSFTVTTGGVLTAN